MLHQLLPLSLSQTPIVHQIIIKKKKWPITYSPVEPLCLSPDQKFCTQLNKTLSLSSGKVYLMERIQCIWVKKSLGFGIFDLIVLHVFFTFSMCHAEWVLFLEISIPSGASPPIWVSLSQWLVRKSRRHFVLNKTHYAFHFVLYMIFKIITWQMNPSLLASPNATELPLFSILCPSLLYGCTEHFAVSLKNSGFSLLYIFVFP